MRSLTNLAKVLVSSRGELWIEAGMLMKAMTSKLSIQPWNTAPDIEQWIQAEIRTKGYENEIAQYVTERLIQGARGMFL